MKIELCADGYIDCKSNFYFAHDVVFYDTPYIFKNGVNYLNGEIDSGVWGASYLLSMYNKKDFTLFEHPQIIIDGRIVSIAEVLAISCYMDMLHPLFKNTKTSVEKTIEKAIKKHKLHYSKDDIRKLFVIDEERFKRPLSGLGNERFKAMAAIAFCCGKEIFCFPWLSCNRFEYYGNNLKAVLKTLANLGKVVIVPRNMSIGQSEYGSVIDKRD